MELDRRSNAILQLIVEAYIHNAQPVSSTAVARNHPELGLSPATIRSVMAELEAADLLQQLHTSSGRVPTERGLRAYVNSMMSPKLRPWDRTRLEATVHADVDAFANALGQTLSGLSGQMAVVAVPKYPGTRLREVGLVRVEARRLLAYFVSPNGLVRQKLLEVDFDLDAQELQSIQNYLNAKLANRTLAQVRQLIQAELADTHASHNRVQEQALAIAARLTPAEAGAMDVVVEGTSHLLDQPEFADLAKLRTLLRAIEERRVLLRLLDRILDNEGVVVVLGSEHRLPHVTDLSCVGCAVVASNGQKTAITLLGPSRMDYGRLVPMVQYATELSGRFWEQF